MSEGAFHAPADRVGWFSEAILSTLPDSRAALRVLDIGCGAGEQMLDLAARMPAAVFVGVDIVPENIRSASAVTTAQRLESRVTFHAADFRAFVGTPAFDIAISYSVLHTVPGSTAMLARRIADALTPAGLFINVMPGRCPYNQGLNAFRALLKTVRSPASDWLLMTAAQALHGRHYDRSLLSERLAYAYTTLDRYDDDLAVELEHLGFTTARRTQFAHASPAQKKHVLRIMQRQPKEAPHRGQAAR